MYMTMLLNHIRAIKSWGEKHAARSSIDVESFQMEVKARNRYFTLHPQFRARIDGRLLNTSKISNQATGFLGWLPYAPIKWSLSSDKLLFKAHMVEHGLRTPAWWTAPEQPDQDYIVKGSRGSFGLHITGPFRAGVAPTEMAASASPSLETRYAEQFIQGVNLKLWIWGRTIFHAHTYSYPAVTGDGVHRIDQLIELLAQTQSPRMPRPQGDGEAIASSLAHQGFTRDEVLADGVSAWLDFRYGRDYESPCTTELADNALPRLSEALLVQAKLAAEALAGDLEARFPAPILYSLDGVIDALGNAWWLEVNSNPTLPPTGYPHVFSTLFETPPIP
ncbi:hypothetical protein [Variovorax paradoxus]|uniref:hypothetical protein n=1 Tax=Variovorax paradoxus TaxID=34073 RepID=UPI0027879A63|nr:hypothetical protein [Variovorax paradoxus]MDP9933511.1 hypothetical protein [Variovorax paradoxus]